MLSRTLTPTLGWSLAAAGAAALLALAAVPALADGPLADAVHRGFAGVCHQMPSRSPHLAAGPMALCHRCVGMLAGLVLGVILAPAAVRPLARAARQRLARVPRRHRAALVLSLAAVPTTVDWALGALGLVANTPASRTLTGAVLGLAAGLVIARELLRSRRPHPTLHHA